MCEPMCLQEKEECLLSEELEAFLRDNGSYASETECQKRTCLLNNLRDVFLRWMENCGAVDNLPDAGKHAANIMHTFGSHRMGLTTSDSDIDVLLLAPRQVKRTDFFASFCDFLREQDGVDKVRPIADAMVPLVKFVYEGVNIDLLFASLGLDDIPERLDLADEELLRNLDPRCALSLNGLRVTEEIAKYVPNYDNYLVALRAVRLWANRRSVYSNVLGFLGGVSWAVFLAKTSEQCPDALPSALVKRFFDVASDWPWPSAVRIKSYDACDLSAALRSWNPKNHRDTFHPMPIITPGRPQHNSAHRVTRSTLEILTREFKRARDGLSKPGRTCDRWEALFAPLDFFHVYAHFLVVRATVLRQDSLEGWSGYVECKLIQLVHQLESNEAVSLVHVNPVSSTDERSREAREWYVGMKFRREKGDGEKQNVDLTENIQTFLDYLCRLPGPYRSDGASVDVQYCGRRQLLYRVRTSGQSDSGERVSDTPSSRLSVTVSRSVTIARSETVGVADSKTASTEVVFLDEESDDLARRSREFFERHVHFVAVSAHAVDPQQYAKWIRFVAVGLRDFATLLERHPSVGSATLNPKPFRYKRSRLSLQWFVGLQIAGLSEGQKIRLDITEDVRRFEERLIAEYGNSLRPGMTVDVKYFKKGKPNDIPPRERRTSTPTFTLVGSRR